MVRHGARLTFAAFVLVLIRRRPEVGSVEVGAQLARSPTGPQSERRPQEEQVPEERLPEGTSAPASPRGLQPTIIFNNPLIF